MCNLYSLTRAREAVLRMFRIGENRGAAFAPLPAIFPGYDAPVVRLTDDGDRELAMMSWGFVLPQPGKAPRRVTNFRDDKARTSSFWRESFEHRRCLVPASSFCEPHGQAKPATWHWFALKGDEPRPLFAFAGIWKRHRGPIRKDPTPVEIDVFSFLTTTPNPLVATVNHERMPVLLTNEAEYETWTRGTASEAFALARELDAEHMHIVREGFDKQDAA